ncbi:TPA: ParA family protein [Clostridioides difficile]|uniref:ParA family protein n=1 Tax=Clostridioides difficile TaxID=1496 RepID=UPI000C9D1631|nr:ParA family protein [Clostridioides difficile]HBG7380955.1 ParA family protein [Clostridioides difficile]
MDAEKQQVISFLNMKGGVSKTTLCKELGMFLAYKKNKNILFVDIDPQANLTQSLFSKYGYKQVDVITEEENFNFKITDVSIEKMIIKGRIREIEKDKVILNLNKGISIIPGTLGIDFITRNTNSSELENSLSNFIDKAKLKEEYDYIFIDCPPTYSSYTTLALKASDSYIIPVRPEAYSILGIKMLLDIVEYIKDVHHDSFKKPLKNLGIVLTNINKTQSPGVKNLIQQIEDSEVIKKWNVEIFDTYFEHNSHIPKDISYDIASSNSEKSLQNLEILADEFLNKVEGGEYANIKG